MLGLFNKDQKMFFEIDEKETSNQVPSSIHYHNRFEVYFLTKGTCRYFLNNSSYDLIAGDIILIPEGIIHNTEYYSPMHKRILLNFSRDYIPPSVIPMLSKLFYLYRNPKVYDEIYALFQKIEQEYNTQDTLSDGILRCCIHMLFFTLLRNKNMYSNTNTTNKHIAKSINYIQTNFSREITLENLSELCGITPIHLSRLFKKETGFGINEYINLLRLQKAEQMITGGTHKNITTIALECGFNDSNYFSIKFKEMFGLSPKKLQQDFIKAAAKQ